MPHFSSAILEADPEGAQALREILGLAPLRRPGPGWGSGKSLGKSLDRSLDKGPGERALGNPQPDARASGRDGRGPGSGRSRKTRPGPLGTGGRPHPHPCRSA